MIDDVTMRNIIRDDVAHPAWAEQPLEQTHAQLSGKWRVYDWTQLLVVT